LRNRLKTAQIEFRNILNKIAAEHKSSPGQPEDLKKNSYLSELGCRLRQEDHRWVVRLRGGVILPAVGASRAAGLDA